MSKRKKEPLEVYKGYRLHQSKVNVHPWSAHRDTPVNGMYTFLFNEVNSFYAMFDTKEELKSAIDAGLVQSEKFPEAERVTVTSKGVNPEWH